MTYALIVALGLLVQTKPDPDQFPLALQKSMELDDLDREIQRVHDTAALNRAQLAASERLAKRGLVSKSDLERQAADLQYQEAREAELHASKAFKTYERDVKGRTTTPDERRAYTLLLDWVRKQVAIAQVDADYQAAQAKRTRALFSRTAVSRQELDDAELAANTAQATVDLGKSRESQIVMEIAARTGEKRSDPATAHRLKSDYLKARIRYFEITAEAARRRLDLGRERSRIGLVPSNDVAIFERASADAAAALAKERSVLERHEAERNAPPRKRSA